MDLLHAGVGLEMCRVAVGIANSLPEPEGLRRLDARSTDLSTKSPLAKKAWSRSISASSRNRGPCARKRFAGSFASVSGVTRDDCRYTADITSRFMSRLTSQPSSRNRTASQSRSSGWLGGSPCAPKSSAVLTIPVPKTWSQKRLTATRAVRGWLGAISHWARPNRLAGAPEEAVAKRPARARSTFSPL